MSNDPVAEWPAYCPTCGTALQTASVSEPLNPDGESLTNSMPVTAVADFCPNPDCPDAGTAPGPGPSAAAM